MHRNTSAISNSLSIGWEIGAANCIVKELDPSLAIVAHLKGFICKRAEIAGTIEAKILFQMLTTRLEATTKVILCPDRFSRDEPPFRGCCFWTSFEDLDVIVVDWARDC